MHEIDGVADQEFRQPHRGGHFDARLRAGPQDRDTAGDEHGDQIDQRKHQQELDADRAPAPEAQTSLAGARGGGNGSVANADAGCALIVFLPRPFS